MEHAPDEWEVYKMIIEHSDDSPCSGEDEFHHVGSEESLLRVSYSDLPTLQTEPDLSDSNSIWFMNEKLYTTDESVKTEQIAQDASHNAYFRSAPILL